MGAGTELFDPTAFTDEELALADKILDAGVTLEPEDGWRFVEEKTEAWSGWRVRFTDRRGSRPRRTSFLLYNESVSRSELRYALVAFLTQVNR